MRFIERSKKSITKILFHSIQESIKRFERFGRSKSIQYFYGIRQEWPTQIDLWSALGKIAKNVETLLKNYGPIITQNIGK
jgi:hypothetical protein